MHLKTIINICTLECKQGLARSAERVRGLGGDCGELESMGPAAGGRRPLSSTPLSLWSLDMTHLLSFQKMLKIQNLKENF